jgi:hypothetical protein
VWEQHSRYFQAKGNTQDPIDILIADLTTLIAHWRAAGEEVILATDANQDVYSGKLSSSLAQYPINMECLFEPVLGEKVPNSHHRGSGKISTMFGSPGLLQGNAMCYPHWYGIGDHRVFVLEVSADSLFGGTYPAIATPRARQLNSKITRI